MSLRVAIQMDLLDAINPQTDSTLLLAVEGQRRGHRLYHYHPSRLGWSRGGRIQARGHTLIAQDQPPALRAGAEELIDLSAMDAVLMRQDPPFDMSYIMATHILERLPARVGVFNNPAAVRDLPEKIMALDFPDLTPATLMTADMAQIREFRREHGDIVLKPVFGYGGRGVSHIPRDSGSFHSIAEHMLERYRDGIIAQKYIGDVRSGDKRIILIDGEPAGAFLRVPSAEAGGDFRANLRNGATAAPCDLTERDRDICAALAPVLRRRELVFAGIDVIGGWLTEVNVTSPTGLRELNRFYGSHPERALWDVFERKVAVRAAGLDAPEPVLKQSAAGGF